jgi:hypothetical protein
VTPKSGFLCFLNFIFSRCSSPYCKLRSSKVNDKKKSSSNDISNVLFSRAKCSKVNDRKLKSSSNDISNVLFSRAKCLKFKKRK